MLLKEQVVYQETINGIDCRVVIGWTTYNKKNIDTYVPQMKVDGEWVDILSGSVIYKMTQVNNSESISVDQLNEAINFLKIKLTKINFISEEIKKLGNLSKLIR